MASAELAAKLARRSQLNESGVSEERTVFGFSSSNEACQTEADTTMKASLASVPPSDELAAKLARRKGLCETTEVDGSVDETPSEINTDESLASVPVCNELAMKLARRKSINEAGEVDGMSESPCTQKIPTSDAAVEANPPVSNELAAKLARRNRINESGGALESTSGPTDGVSTDTNNPSNPVLAAVPQSKELAEKLQRRNKINEGVIVGEQKVVEKDITREFPEFSAKQIADAKDKFAAVDADKDGAIRLEELKKLLEVLGVPQTHFTLRNLMKEVEIEKEVDISLRDFLKVYRRVKVGKMLATGLEDLTSKQSIDVHEVGVSGAKNFFMAKQLEAKSGGADLQLKANQEALRLARQDEEARKKQFKDRIANFAGSTPPPAK